MKIFVFFLLIVTPLTSAAASTWDTCKACSSNLDCKNAYGNSVCTTKRFCTSAYPSAGLYCLKNSSSLVQCISSSDCVSPNYCQSAPACSNCVSDSDCLDFYTGQPYCATTGSCIQCKINSHCTSGKVCSSSGTCVACVDASTCLASNRLYCNQTSNECVECLTATECAVKNPSLPYCSSIPSCVECLTNDQCLTKSASTPFCWSSKCIQCNSNTECSNNFPSTPYCINQKCYECSNMGSTTQCSAIYGPAKSYCTYNHLCVECLDESPCTSTRYCSNNQCISCSSNTLCPYSYPICNAGTCSKCVNTNECQSRKTWGTYIKCSSGKCVQYTCNNDNDCGSETPWCFSDFCVECRNSYDCPFENPICESNTCRQCNTHNECNDNLPERPYCRLQKYCICDSSTCPNGYKCEDETCKKVGINGVLIALIVLTSLGLIITGIVVFKRLKKKKNQTSTTLEDQNQNFSTKKKLKMTVSQAYLIGNNIFDVVSDYFYYSFTEFPNKTLQVACLVSLFISPFISMCVTTQRIFNQLGKTNQLKKYNDIDTKYLQSIKKGLIDRSTILFRLKGKLLLLPFVIMVGIFLLLWGLTYILGSFFLWVSVFLFECVPRLLMPMVVLTLRLDSLICYFDKDFVHEYIYFDNEIHPIDSNNAIQKNDDQANEKSHMFFFVFLECFTENFPQIVIQIIVNVMQSLWKFFSIISLITGLTDITHVGYLLIFSNEGKVTIKLLDMIWSQLKAKIQGFILLAVILTPPLIFGITGLQNCLEDCDSSCAAYKIALVASIIAIPSCIFTYLPLATSDKGVLHHS